MYGMPALRFRVGRIPVEIELFHFIAVAIIGIGVQPAWADSLRWTLMFTVVGIVSLLAHHLCTALVIARFGRPSGITLHQLGGVTTYAGSLTARQRIVAHLAGPVLLLVLVGLPARWWFWNGSFTSRALFELAFALYTVNFWWSIITLLPIWPLDGGHVLGALTELRNPRGNWRLVHWVSIPTALIGGAVALSQSRNYGYILLLGMLLAVQNFMVLQGSMRPFLLHPHHQDTLAGAGGGASFDARGRGRGGRDGGRPHPAREPRAPKPVKAKPPERIAKGFALLARGDTDAARVEAEAVRAGKAPAELQAIAGEIIAWSYLQERNVPKARAALADIADRSKVSRCLVAALEITGADEDRGIQAVALALVDEPEGPAKRQVIDYVGRRELGVPLARHLLALPNGQGFEASVRLAAVLAECGRREQATKVQDLLLGG
jgi:stage IV sporulation protein FB